MSTHGDEDVPGMGDVTSALEYWPSPPPWGWTADDLDRLPAEGPNGEPDFFKHVELIDGAFVFMSPQRRFHELVIRRLTNSLEAQAPDHLSIVMTMDVKIENRTRLRPDVAVIDSAVAKDVSRTFYEPSEVHLVVEVVSPESRERDRQNKPPRYAKAGIAHFWRIEESEGRPVVYVYELDPATRTYALGGIHHGKLGVSLPFGIVVDLDDLPR